MNSQKYGPLKVTGYDAGIMTVILADKQFNSYYSLDVNKQGIVATIPWVTTGKLSFM